MISVIAIHSNKQKLGDYLSIPKSWIYFVRKNMFLRRILSKRDTHMRIAGNDDVVYIHLQRKTCSISFYDALQTLIRSPMA